MKKHPVIAITGSSGAGTRSEIGLAISEEQKKPQRGEIFVAVGVNPRLKEKLRRVLAAFLLIRFQIENNLL